VYSSVKRCSSAGLPANAAWWKKRDVATCAEAAERRFRAHAADRHRGDAGVVAPARPGSGHCPHHGQRQSVPALGEFSVSRPTRPWTSTTISAHSTMTEPSEVHLRALCRGQVPARRAPDNLAMAPTPPVPPRPVPGELNLQRFGFLLMPNFFLIALSSAVDPLRLANMALGRRVFDYVTVGVSAEPVLSTTASACCPTR